MMDFSPITTSPSQNDQAVPGVNLVIEVRYSPRTERISFWPVGVDAVVSFDQTLVDGGALGAAKSSPLAADRWTEINVAPDKTSGLTPLIKIFVTSPTAGQRIYAVAEGGCSA